MKYLMDTREMAQWIKALFPPFLSPAPPKKKKKCEAHLKTQGCGPAVSNKLHFPREPDLAQAWEPVLQESASAWVSSTTSQPFALAYTEEGITLWWCRGSNPFFVVPPPTHQCTSSHNHRLRLVSLREAVFGDAAEGYIGQIPRSVCAG